MRRLSQLRENSVELSLNGSRSGRIGGALIDSLSLLVGVLLYGLGGVAQGHKASEDEGENHRCGNETDCYLLFFLEKHALYSKRQFAR